MEFRNRAISTSHKILYLGGSLLLLSYGSLPLMFVISIVIRADVLYYYAICLCVRIVSGFIDARWLPCLIKLTVTSI